MTTSQTCPTDDAAEPGATRWVVAGTRQRTVMSVRALRYHGPGEIRLETVALPELRAGEVTVAVKASAVCGSDVHFVTGAARPSRAPLTLGHEISGVIEASRDQRWHAGDEVIVLPGTPCAQCRYCRDGEPMLCERMTMIGIDQDGGLADRLVVAGASLVSKPAGLAWDMAALAPDAAASALHAATCRGGVTEGSSVLIIGIGGLGGFAVQAAKQLGAVPVIAADVREHACRVARRLGADETILVEEGRSPGRQTKLLVEGGVDVAIEFVGSPATVDSAMKSIRPGGRAVVAGVGRQPLTTLPPVLWSTHQYTLTGSFGSHRRDVDLVLDWMTAGRLVGIESSSIPLESVADAIGEAAAGVRHGRVVATP